MKTWIDEVSEITVEELNVILSKLQKKHKIVFYISGEIYENFATTISVNSDASVVQITLT